MVSVVEGDWGDFVFRLADTSYYPLILDHLRDTLYVDEPLNRLAGNSLAKQSELDYLALQFMEENLSFFVIHKPTNRVSLKFEGTKLEKVLELCLWNELKKKLNLKF